MAPPEEVRLGLRHPAARAVEPADPVRMECGPARAEPPGPRLLEARWAVPEVLAALRAVALRVAQRTMVRLDFPAARV